MSYSFKKVTGDFKELYKLVTLEIMMFTGNPMVNKLSTNEIQWINNLVAGFQDKFDKWELAEDKYLQQAHSKRGRLFWLSACAFLHIAKDLPNVIEKNLDRKQSGKEIFRHKLIFNKLEIPLEKALDAVWKKPLDMKILFWKGWHTQNIFLHWMFNMRHKAWDYALFLLYSPNIAIAADELDKKVLGAMIAAQKKRLFYDRVLSLRLGLITGVILGMVSIALFRFTLLPEIFILLSFLESGRQLENILEKKVYKDFLAAFYFHLEKVELSYNEMNQSEYVERPV